MRLIWTFFFNFFLFTVIKFEEIRVVYIDLRRVFFRLSLRNDLLRGSVAYIEPLAIELKI